MNKSTGRRKTAWMASLGLLFMAMGQSVLAGHFHYYINLETTYAVNQRLMLSEVSVSWVYGGEMSALMKKQSFGYKVLGQATINQLRKDHYFANIQFNGKPVKTGQVTQFELHEFTVKGRTALRLDFTLPIVQPLNMKGKNEITWSFSDPTGVAVMIYDTPKNIHLGSVLQSLCKPTMNENNNGQHGDPVQLLSLECSI